MELFLYTALEVENSLMETRDKKFKKFTDTEWKCRVAVHLLSKLGMSSEFTMDKNCQDKEDVCPCGCLASINWGDTVMGNERTWYGPVDLLLGSSDLTCTCMPGNPNDQNINDTETLPGQSSEGVSPLMTFRARMLSQTIVFSFLQRKRQPESHLIPAIGISKTDIKFFFYDSVNDIFLESPEIPLFSDIPGKHGQLNKYTIMALWLVVNYKSFISPITDDMENEGKFGFFDCAKNNLMLYRDGIDFGEIEPVKFPPTKPWRRPHALKKLKSSNN